MKAQNFFRSNPGPVIISLALLSVVMHLLVANNLEYHRDELLYFSLGQHPDFGYATVPPITYKTYHMIEDKKASFIYCENYGQASAITVIGKKYGLPEAISFSESFRYWIPNKFNPDIKSAIYINDELGEDIQRLFSKIKLIGKISDPDAREYGTAVYLCENPKTSFNEFWKNRLEILFEHNSR